MQSISEPSPDVPEAAVDPERTARTRQDLAVGGALGENVDRVEARVSDLVRIGVEYVVGAKRQSEVAPDGVADVEIGGELRAEFLRCHVPCLGVDEDGIVDRIFPP